MKGDFSRLTFDKSKHYSGVLLQQGRVLLDADWNEQQHIAAHRMRTGTADLVGPAGFPADGGMAIKASSFACNLCFIKASKSDAVCGWIVGERASILHWDGKSFVFQRAPEGVSATLRSVCFVDEKTGWAAGDSGTILHTNDGGETWRSQKVNTTRPFFSIYFLQIAKGQYAGCAAGARGTLLYTADGGEKWLALETQEKAQLNAVHLLKGTGRQPYRIFAVGDAQTIVEFSWDIKKNKLEAEPVTFDNTSAPKVDLYAVNSLMADNAPRACAAGADGRIFLKTKKVWTSQPSGVSVALKTVGITGKDGKAAGGFSVVGEDGTVCLSPDGKKWLAYGFLVSENIRAVNFIDYQRNPLSSTLTLLGDAGGLFRQQKAGWSRFTRLITGLSVSAGRAYLDGVLCEREKETTLGLPQEEGIFLAYLECRERHISAVQDPRIRETALGGPDTCTRTQTVCRVGFLPVQAATETKIQEKGLAALSDAWQTLTAGAGCALCACVKPEEPESHPCSIAAGGGYSGLENQLYRVEIHESGGGKPTFKWSRDNGSVVFPFEIESVNDQQTQIRLVVQNLGSYYPVSKEEWIGTWVEILQDDDELSLQPGALMQVADIPSDQQMVLAGTLDISRWSDKAKHPLVRRWDQKGDAHHAGALPVQENTWLELESGVQIRFQKNGRYAVGDYWQIPARTDTADIEWPQRADEPVYLPPAGIRRHYAPLAFVEIRQAGPNRKIVTQLDDCRKMLLPLAGRALHIAGINWHNDERLPYNAETAVVLFNEGFQILLDDAPDAWTVNATSIGVTIDLPDGTSRPVPGELTVQGHIITWRPISQTERAKTSSGEAKTKKEINFVQQFTGSTAAAPISAAFRIRIALKGNLIWKSDAAGRKYLDGQAFGKPRRDTDEEGNAVIRYDLDFPSGAGIKGSDFEGWFYLCPVKANTTGRTKKTTGENQ